MRDVVHEEAAVKVERVFSRQLSLIAMSALLLMQTVIAAPDLLNLPSSSPPSINLDRFEGDIRAFEEKDRKELPAPGGTVFVGSSTFTRWDALEKTFSEFKAINRGFGGSTLIDINHYVTRLVSKYKPKNVVLYAGSNDIAELKHSGQQVFADTKTFVQLVRQGCPGAHIFIISSSVAPCRTQWSTEFDTANKLIATYVKANPDLHYIDVIPAMRDTDGKMRRDLFGPDNLHMNSSGYSRWVPLIKRALKQS